MDRRPPHIKDPPIDEPVKNEDDLRNLAFMRLKRYCFLGSFQPVKIHLPYPPIVSEVFYTLNKHCKLLDVNRILRVLQIAFKSQLFRKDEATLVFAIYLLGDIEPKAVTKARAEFNNFIKTDIELFLFCKYATAVHKFLKRPVFCKTLKKAVTAWYAAKTSQELSNMFRTNRGRNGFTHTALFKLCRIPDHVLGTKYIYDSFNNTCTTLIASRENPLPSPPLPPPAKVPKQKTTSTETNVKKEDETAEPTTSSAATSSATNPIVAPPKPKECNVEEIRSQVLAISEIRTVNEPEKALKLIEENKLCFEELPYHFMEFPEALNKVIPTMSCRQLFQCIHAPQIRKQFAKQEVLKACRKKFQQKNALKNETVDPIMCLLNLDVLHIADPLKPLNNKQKNREQIVKFSRNLLIASFNDTKPLNKNIHITINMQNFYMSRRLKNTKATVYKYAATALAFTYFKVEENCDVFRWCESNGALQPVEFKKHFQYFDAFNEVNKVKNLKNKQNLWLPIAEAMKKKDTIKYDLFICIVPAATRGNKSHRSETLAEYLTNYRSACANNAKFVIVDLCRYKKSMQYAESSCENILEICGIDTHTVGIIQNFALDHFD